MRNEYYCEIKIALLNENVNEMIENYVIKEAINKAGKVYIYYNEEAIKKNVKMRFLTLVFIYNINTIIALKNTILCPFLEQDFISKKRTMHKNRKN